MGSHAGSSSQSGRVTFTLPLLDVEMLKLVFKPAFILSALIYIHVNVYPWMCACTHTLM